jgi:hypothetical protein
MENDWPEFEIPEWGGDDKKDSAPVEFKLKAKTEKPKEAVSKIQQKLEAKKRVVIISLINFQEISCCNCKI